MIEPKHVQPEGWRRSGDVATVVYKFAAGEGLLAHDHPFSHNARVVSGSITVEIGARQRTLGPGGVILFPALVEHAILADVRSEVEMDFAWGDISTFLNQEGRAL